MSSLNTAIRILRANPLSIWKSFFNKARERGWLNILSDELYLKIRYRTKFDRKLNLKTPHTYNEKLQWLKLYDRKPEYHRKADKYEVKKFVEETIGEQYIIPTLGVWDKVEDILPEKFDSEVWDTSLAIGLLYLRIEQKRV